MKFQKKVDGRMEEAREVLLTGICQRYLTGSPTREEVMNDINDLLGITLKYQINPLPQLRKHFHGLVWEYKKLSEKDSIPYSALIRIAIKDIAKIAVFAWRINEEFVFAYPDDKIPNLRDPLYFFNCFNDGFKCQDRATYWNF